MRGDNRHATSHRLKRRKPKTFIKRWIDEDTGEIVQSSLIFICNEPGQNDFVFVGRIGNRLKSFFIFPSASTGDDEGVFAQCRMTLRLERIIGRNEGGNILARFECRQRENESVRQMIFFLYSHEIRIIVTHRMELLSYSALNDSYLLLWNTIIVDKIILGRF